MAPETRMNRSLYLFVLIRVISWIAVVLLIRSDPRNNTNGHEKCLEFLCLVSGKHFGHSNRHQQFAVCHVDGNLFCFFITTG